MPTDLVRRHGVAAQTRYPWKEKYCRMQIAEAKRMKALKEENRELKRLAAGQALKPHAVYALLENMRRRWSSGGRS